MIDTAIQFGARAHEGQVRKYTGEPYITHPVEVAEIVATVDHTPEMLMAAILHDTVEDTPVTFDDLEAEFGDEVTSLVYWLTEVSVKGQGNRAFRKRQDLVHYSQGPAASQTIKVADMIHNSRCIMLHDRKFWVQYRREKMALLDALTRADSQLLEQAWDMIVRDEQEHRL
jgi:(p)ppGpp synthase/HD superfamily hydrolase